MLKLIKHAMTIAAMSFLSSHPAHAQGSEGAESTVRAMMNATRIEFHWMSDGNTFWYADGNPDNIAIHKVDPVANTNTDFFDVDRLRDVLAEGLGRTPPGEGVPFSTFSFNDESETTVRFSVEGRFFVLDLADYALSEAPASTAATPALPRPRVLRQGRYGRRDIREVLSPDAQWFAHLSGEDLWLRRTADENLQQITSDGTPERPWGYSGIEAEGWAWWSPDSRTLAVRRGNFQGVEAIPLVDYSGPASTVEWVRSPHNVPAGGVMPSEELYLLDVASRRLVRVDLGTTQDAFLSVLKWSADGTDLFLVKADRQQQRLDLMAVDALTDATRTILTETSSTFALDPLWLRLPEFTLLQDGKRFIWASERDGWRHLYLYGLNGQLERQLTQGPFTTGDVITVDEAAGWVYFICSAGEQPYDGPLCRVSLQGQEFAVISEARGRHEPVHFAPSKDFFVDTYSTVNIPPVIEVRRSDGQYLQTLSEFDAAPLKDAFGWAPPEQFVAKAADGETDIYGVLYKPSDFDPNKKYPVLDNIYGGPFVMTVPQTFVHDPQFQQWANLGCFVLVVEGRGTAGRSKEFQDVVYGNIGRFEIPDHVAALRQVAASRPYLDLDRVGIIGSSWGGYLATRALLLEPDFYKVGIAVSPASEPAGKATVYEPYMGRWDNNRAGHEYASNLPLAGNLEGKLLLIHGTNDVNAPLGQTMRMVAALVENGKPHDLIILPGQDHYVLHARGPNGEYARSAIRRYLLEHLIKE